MARKTTKLDPLIAALIDKIPAPGGDWPVEQQLSWLRLMAMAMDNVYGGGVAATLGDQRAGYQAAAQSPPAPVAPPPFPSQKVVERHRFVIDKSGMALDTKRGEAINPEDIEGDFIVDERGIEGDVKTILWADGSTGILRLPDHVAISAS